MTSIKTKKEAQGGSGFHCHQEKSPKDDESHERMFSPKDHPLFKEPKVYHWCRYHLTWTVHREDKFEKGEKVSKMDEAQKEKRGERTSTRPTMHSYVHLQVRILMSFSFRRQWFKGRSKYEEADDGYCSMNSNTLE